MTPIRSLVAVACGALILSLVACTSSRPEGDDADDEPTGPTITAPEADLKALADGNNQFAIELYKKLAAKTDGNIVLSPYSISAALAMTYAGARGETAEQMRQTLHFTLPPERLHPAFGALSQHLQANGKAKPFELNIANALWGQKGFPFRPEFLELTRHNYNGGFRQMDFAGDPEGSRQTINRWVEERTQDKIKELLKTNDLDPTVRLVLTNAIYFRSDWRHPFEKGRTYDAGFETAPGVRVEVPMMRHTTAKFRTCKTKIWQLLELPYAGDRLAMVVAVPVKRCMLRDAAEKMTLAMLQDGLDQLRESAEREVDVSLPRFRLRSRFELRQALFDMGMPRVFTTADFSGITPRGGLRIKDVIHGGNIEVDEVGTVAAAATHVIMTLSARPVFQANQPFLFLIRDIKTGGIVFMGRVVDPR